MSSKGFTLIELAVTIGIMAVITAVTLANHSKFGGNVMLRNLAYEMALIIREAQTYGISVKKSSKVNTVNFEAGYGVHFDAREQTRYLMFTDTHRADGGTGGDGIYTNALELVTIYTIGRGYTINGIYAIGNDGTRINAQNCATGKPVLDILFKRPEPDAIIRLCGDERKLYNSAEIELKAPRGGKMRVRVEVSGQISVVGAN